MRRFALSLLLLACLCMTGCQSQQELRNLVDLAMATPSPSPAETPSPTPEPGPTTKPPLEWLEGDRASYDMPETQAPRYRLVVDITNQALLVYEGEEIAQTFRCSTGEGSSPTPVGDYSLEGPVSRWGYFAEGEYYARYVTAVKDGLFIHSVIHAGRDPNTLSHSLWEKLGSRSTRGNIALATEDAQWIYENCPQGTPCTIREGRYDEALQSQTAPPFPVNNRPVR